ncbi:hypothetical protein [Kribbella sp. CA-293567]|uniref:hypothetical protein n=1 Tax=Kribbella sp. CA-293567 TaxID=3002436 RepID=UPI0022DDE498|nr:hypothetical protein [Kribbella sp. CA-293567]WBQ03025.1 hypothetical protein OX958_23945 [Kribbella sp. CA-293567]
MNKQDIKKVRALIQKRTRPEWTTPICMRGDLVAAMLDLDRQLVRIKQENPTQMLVGNTKAREIAEQMAKVRAEADEHTIVVRMRGLEKKDWKALVAQHPPEDPTQDFADSIYNDAIPASIIEPELDAETLDQFLEGVTQGQWDELAAAAHLVNVGDGRVPFSGNESRARQSSEETSQQPDPGE